MAALSWWKALALVGTLADSLTKAADGDGRITVDEALVIVGTLAKQAGLRFDDTGSSFILEIIAEIFAAAEDKVLTVAELIRIGEKVCLGMGINLDKTGFSIPG